MSLRTLNDIFFAVVQRNTDAVMMHRESGRWIAISPEDLYHRVVNTARALRQWGVAMGDRVAILSENRPEWTIADFACFLIGAVVVPIYTTLTAEQITYILEDSGAKVIFVSSERQLGKVESIQNRTKLQKLILMDSATQTGRVEDMLKIMGLTPVPDDAEFSRLTQRISPDDLATIIYTSGTTGIPKGVMLTHGNMTSNISFSLAEFCLAGDIETHAFIWNQGTLRDIGTLGGTFESGNAINEAGEVAGGGTLAGDLVFHAFLWRGGVLTDLGTVGGNDCSNAFDINLRGQVVGQSFPCSVGPGGLAFLWENGRIIDLNVFVPPTSNLILGDVEKINDQGEMFGSAVLPNGDQHAFLLIPCQGDEQGCQGENPARLRVVHSLWKFHTNAISAASRTSDTR